MSEREDREFRGLTGVIGMLLSKPGDRALKTYIKNRREYLYEESVKRTKGESRRSLLPRMLHAAKVRRQEILLARLEETGTSPRTDA